MAAWILAQTSRTSTQLCRIFSTWRLIFWTLLDSLKPGYMECFCGFIHVTGLRKDSKQKKPVILHIYFFRSFMCWIWPQPSCIQWFWVLRIVYTPCSLACRRRLRVTSPRWVRSCCWRRESPLTLEDRSRTVCQMDWYVTHKNKYEMWNRCRPVTYFFFILNILVVLKYWGFSRVKLLCCCHVLTVW